MVNRISFERKLTTNAGTFKFEYSKGPLGNVLKTSRGCPESTSQGRPLNVRLGRPLDVISGHPQDVKLGRSWDGQVAFLGDVLGTLEENVHGTSWGSMFAGWDISVLK